ncbi:hypothetical protein BDW71DRAFT_181506 [Aspergillus fruticulosus]
MEPKCYMVYQEQYNQSSHRRYRCRCGPSRPRTLSLEQSTFACKWLIRIDAPDWPVGSVILMSRRRELPEVNLAVRSVHCAYLRRVGICTLNVALLSVSLGHSVVGDMIDQIYPCTPVTEAKLLLGSHRMARAFILRKGVQIVSLTSSLKEALLSGICQ